MKEKIKYFYNLKLWTKGMVKQAVIKSVISKAEYKEITGESYK